MAKGTIPEFADEAFVALVHIPVPGGSDQREVWLMGYSTEEECLIQLKRMYPTDPNAKFTISPFDQATITGEKLRRGHIRPWH